MKLFEIFKKLINTIIDNGATEEFMSMCNTLVALANVAPISFREQYGAGVWQVVFECDEYLIQVLRVMKIGTHFKLYKHGRLIALWEHRRQYGLKIKTFDDKVFDNFLKQPYTFTLLKPMEAVHVA